MKTRIVLAVFALGLLAACASSISDKEVYAEYTFEFAARESGLDAGVIEPETTLLPLSLVLKEMRLPTATYEGSPVEAAADRENDSERFIAPQSLIGSHEVTTDRESQESPIAQER